MFFISSQKLVSLSRYVNFCPKKIKLISIFMTSQPSSQKLQITYFATSHKVKATRQ